MDQNLLKKQAAEKALEYIKPNCILGVGTGSTVNHFIELLASIKSKIEVTVSSSKATTERLKALHIPVIDANQVNHIDVYVDGADEVNPLLQCIKGGGGALTGEKILVSMAKTFICVVDESKYVRALGNFPVAIEVIPMARSQIARTLVKNFNADPQYRQNFVTDYGNVILDVHNLQILQPEKMESDLNQIPGVVCNGIFAKRPADILLLAKKTGVEVINQR